jgi:hypothetical protein
VSLPLSLLLASLLGLLLAEPSIMDFPDLGLAQVASASLTSVSLPLTSP